MIFDGEDITNTPPNKRQLNTVFQKYALFTHMSIAENIAFGLKIKGKSKSYIDDKIKYALKLVNLDGFENRSVDSLSGGQQQRIAIARAIVMNPKYLFCDEPNSGLDPKTSLVIDELLSGITKEYGITTIINTHDMNSVMGIGENIVFIADGRKEWQGDKDSVISSRNKKLNDLVFASDLFKKVREVEREEK